MKSTYNYTKSPKIVKVMWLDSSFNSDYVYEDTRDSLPFGVICECLGFLLHQDDKFIRIAMDRGITSPYYRRVMDITKNSIIGMKTLK